MFARLAAAYRRTRNAWHQRCSETARLTTAMVWAHSVLAEDHSEARALWVMYFLNRAMCRGRDLNTAATAASAQVALWRSLKEA